MLIEVYHQVQRKIRETYEKPSLSYDREKIGLKKVVHNGAVRFVVMSRIQTFFWREGVLWHAFLSCEAVLSF